MLDHGVKNVFLALTIRKAIYDFLLSTVYGHQSLYHRTVYRDHSTFKVSKGLTLTFDPKGRSGVEETSVFNLESPPAGTMTSYLTSIGHHLSDLVPVSEICRLAIVFNAFQTLNISTPKASSGDCKTFFFRSNIRPYP